MRLRLLALLSALLLLGALPIGALEEEGTELDPADEPPIQECTGSQELLTVDGHSGEVDAPSWIIDSETTDLVFRLDLQAPEGARGQVDVSIDWDVPANDYDLSVNGTLSDNYQPFDPTGEQVSVTVGNCGLVRISVIDFLAPVVVDSISVEVSVREI